MLEIVQVVFLGMVEGLTEFMPISSTGHLIVAGHLMGFVGEKAKLFEVFIQLGAILAVVICYRNRFINLFSIAPFGLPQEGMRGFSGLSLLALTTFPALVVGAFAHSYVKQHLFGPATVALGLALGGGIMILVEQKPRLQGVGLDRLTWKEALAIGCFQCCAIWPGISRSGATLVGGMLLGIERKAAAEYSFLTAVPVLSAAVLFDLYKNASLLERSDALPFFIGFGVAFIFALIGIRTFMALLGRVTLKPFGWYRIGISPIIYGFMG